MTTVVRQLRDFAVGAAIAVAIATVAFVAVRNHELAEQQIDRASRATRALADGAVPLPDVHAVIVGEAVPSPKHPYLRLRRVKDGGVWRALVQGGSPDDKLFYDGANRFERRRPVAPIGDAGWARVTGADGAFAELLRDGSGRAISVEPVPDGVAVAVTPPGRPAPFPFLVIIGVLGLGAALAAAGALIGGRLRFAGTALGIATLAIPCVLWGAPFGWGAILLVATLVAIAQRRGLTDRCGAALRSHRVAFGFLAPAAIAMLVLVATPFAIGLAMGFYDHHQGTWTFVGLHNFGEILSGGGRALDDPLNFWFILGVTVLWTVVNVALHVTIGVALALALSRTWLRGRGIFRVLLILPWAVPNYITALLWKGMFDVEYGAINSLLGAAGLDGVSWMTTWANAFTANVVTNTWLGFPFMMVVAIGALQSIPRELYEAASVDGASAWQRFRHITVPHLRPALGPAIALGSIWTFNMFNVIYLVSAGRPGNSTNILVTDAYRWAFERGERYGMASAYATIIFGILLLWTVFGTRIVRGKGAAT